MIPYGCLCLLLSAPLVFPPPSQTCSVPSFPLFPRFPPFLSFSSFPSFLRGLVPVGPSPAANPLDHNAEDPCASLASLVTCSWYGMMVYHSIVYTVR